MLGYVSVEYDNGKIEAPEEVGRCRCRTWGGGFTRLWEQQRRGHRIVSYCREAWMPMKSFVFLA